MEKVFEWVDNTNLYLSMIYYNNTLGIDYKIPLHYRQYISEAECYQPEYTTYAYTITAELLRLDNNNKEACIRRLFRNSREFFTICMQRREQSSKHWIPLITASSFMYSGQTIQALTHRLEADILEFYIEVVHLCLECRLTPSELYPFPELKEVIVDIEMHTRLTHQEKIEAQKSLLPTKWQDYIIGANKEAWERLITEELNNAGEHSGRLFAMIILAMRREGAVMEIVLKKRFYALVRDDFPLLSSDQSINKYLNTNSPNSYDPPILDDEIEALIKKVGCY